MFGIRDCRATPSSASHRPETLENPFIELDGYLMGRIIEYLGHVSSDVDAFQLR